MKKVPEAIRKDLAGHFGYDVERLAFLGGGREDSDGIVYRTETPDGPQVFKIIGAWAADPNAALKTEARAAFFAYLGSWGLETVEPLPNAAGNLIETAVDGADIFLAYRYRFMAGEHPAPERWTDDLVRAWGRTIGTAHRLAAVYPVWEGLVPPEGGEPLLTWRQEIEGFLSFCQDEDVRAYWQFLRERLEALPYTRHTAGFIHNDPHMQNVLVEDGRVKLLDFDVANCHFFACDLAIAIQSVLFAQGGGLDRPVSDQAAIDRFADALLSGYAETAPDAAAVMGDIELFIGYRRALLFTVMQGWLDTKPEIRASYKRVLLSEARVLR